MFIFARAPSDVAHSAVEEGQRSAGRLSVRRALSCCLLQPCWCLTAAAEPMKKACRAASSQRQAGPGTQSRRQKLMQRDGASCEQRRSELLPAADNGGYLDQPAVCRVASRHADLLCDTNREYCARWCGRPFIRSRERRLEAVTGAYQRAAAAETTVRSRARSRRSGTAGCALLAEGAGLLQCRPDQTEQYYQRWADHLESLSSLLGDLFCTR